LFGYDSTNNRAVLGNGTNTSILTWITATPTGNALAAFSGTLGLLVSSAEIDNGTFLEVDYAGTAGQPAITLVDTTTGWWRDASGNWDWSSGGTTELRLRSTGVELLDTNYFGWAATGATTAVDTTMCRNAAGVIELGSGTACGTSGGLLLAGEISEGTKFTASGCSNSTTAGGASAGSFKSGTTGTCTVTVTMGNSLTAPNGWVCKVWDTTTTTDIIAETAFTTTSATFSGTTVSSDVIIFGCQGF